MAGYRPQLLEEADEEEAVKECVRGHRPEPRVAVLRRREPKKFEVPAPSSPRRTVKTEEKETEKKITHFFGGG